jgi:hypothetical protein
VTHDSPIAPAPSPAVYAFEEGRVRIAHKDLASLRDISGALFDRGYATPLGKPYSASAVQSMLG